MNFREFQIYYAKRISFFKSEISEELSTKAYIKLKKGSEIRILNEKYIKRTEENKISKVLIDIPQIDLVKRRIDTALNSIQISHEGDIRIIYGDFGHGKSQTANLIIEDIRSKLKSNQIAYIENITTFKNFIIGISDYFTFKFKDQTHFFNKIEPILDALKEIDDSLKSISEIRSLFVKILKTLSERNYNIIIFLDELNKILHDPIEIQHWIDFFITLTDESNISFLLVCLIPQTSSRTLVNIDKRMERWNTYFNIDAIYLDGKYGNKVMEGIGNILALSSVNHYINLPSQSLELIYDVYQYRKNYLEGASIRKVNTWTINLSEFIIKCSKYNFWDKVKAFDRMDRTEKGLYIESKLRTLLSIDLLPQFELNIKDSEEKEIYRVEYNNTNLQAGDKKSDGHYQQYVQYMNTEKIKLNIAVEIKFTQDKNHQDSQIEKIIKLSEQYPTIFFSLGPQKSIGEELKKSLSKLSETDFEKYPIFVINIPQNLSYPLLLLPKDKNIAGFNQIKHILIAWSNIITAHREELEFFFREIQSKLIQRKILLRGLELAGLSSKKIKPIKGEKEEDELKKARRFLVGSFIAMLEEVKSYKYLSTIESEIKDMLNNQFPRVATIVIKKIPNFIDLLEMDKFVSRGGKTKTTIKKEDKWNAHDVMTFLESKFI